MFRPILGYVPLIWVYFWDKYSPGAGSLTLAAGVNNDQPVILYLLRAAGTPLCLICQAILLTSWFGGHVWLTTSFLEQVLAVPLCPKG